MAKRSIVICVVLAASGCATSGAHSSQAAGQLLADVAGVFIEGLVRSSLEDRDRDRDGDDDYDYDANGYPADAYACTLDHIGALEMFADDANEAAARCRELHPHAECECSRLADRDH